MFTSKSIFLLITVITLLAIAWNTDITMVYIFFVIAFVMFVLSFVHLQLTIPDIGIKRDLHDTAYEDDVLNVRISIQNRRSLGAYFFEIVDRFPGGSLGEEESSLFVLKMDGREIKNASYVITCYKRGP